VPPPEARESTLQQRISGTNTAIQSKRGLQPFIAALGVVVLLVGVFLAGRFVSGKKQSPTVAYTAESSGQETATQEVPPLPHQERTAVLSETKQPVLRVPHTTQVSSKSARAAPPPRAPVAAPDAGEEKGNRFISPQLEYEEREENRSVPFFEPAVAAEEEADLDLEGIVWSDAPGSRFAIINGYIVRQGSTVEGFRVARIAMDYVLIQSHDRTWETRLFVQ